MGCCRKEKKKNKNKNDLKKKIPTHKVEKKKIIDDPLPQKIIDQDPLLRTENLVRQEPIKTSSPESPFFDDEISATDNISPIKTFDDLQALVQQHGKPISIVFFYGRYCPYSKRIMPGLRQWARSNQDRIYLYEADVEQASSLVDYYHVRIIPTIMAFEENQLLTPIWQRTADNVLSTLDVSEPMENDQEISADHHPIDEIFQGKIDQSNNVLIILDPLLKGSNRILKTIETPNTTKQEQYLLILDNNQSITDQSKLILAITNEDEQNEVLKTMNPSNSTKSMASSQQSSYIWNRSIPSIEDASQKSQSIREYHGRMVSQSAFNIISKEDQSKKKSTWNEQLDDNMNTPELSFDAYPQHIHLPNSNEISYEKHYDNTDEFYPSSSFDRFSTLPYQHINETTYLSTSQQEEICVLYLGPNRCRGFEDNLPMTTNAAKLSLLTLTSHSLVE